MYRSDFPSVQGWHEESRSLTGGGWVVGLFVGIALAAVFLANPPAGEPSPAEAVKKAIEKVYSVPCPLVNKSEGNCEVVIRQEK